GWELKPYSIVHSGFQEVLFLDADNVPVRNPEFLFSANDYLRTGAIFWPDIIREARADAVWNCAEVKRPPGMEFESGQMVVNKKSHWKSMRLALWFNEQSDFLYEHLHGDKETYHLAMEKLGDQYAMISHSVVKKEGVMYQNDFDGKILFQHRSLCKWALKKRNERPDGFALQKECERFLAELRARFPSLIRAAGRKPEPVNTKQ
ncbi:MAG: hypothetical protein JWM04_1085, partial [Verrucomicrobiales bacterium]|nr:hypothetical protein [Verrucomicrobiales bacterium]